MSKRLDLAGKKIGNIEVIDFSHNEKSHAIWNAICPKCEKPYKISSSSLINQAPKACQACRFYSKTVNNLEQNIITLYKNEIPMQEIIDRYGVGNSFIDKILKDNKIKRNRNLTKEENLMIYHYRLSGVKVFYLVRLYDRTTNSINKIIQKVKKEVTQ